MTAVRHTIQCMPQSSSPSNHVQKLIEIGACVVLFYGIILCDVLVRKEGSQFAITAECVSADPDNNLSPRGSNNLS